MKKYTGYVEWFDASGEGMVFSPFHKASLYVHWSAIKSENAEMVRSFKMLKKGHPVEFTVYSNLYMSQIDSVWPLHFNYSIENEYKLASLMNHLFEIGHCSVFDLADLYYSEAA